MAAPDLETLFDFETNFELAAQTFLSDALDVAVSFIYRSLEQEDFELPRAHVEFQLGEALDPPGKRTDEPGELAYVKYGATLNVVIVSDGTDAKSQAEHRTLRAKARAALEIAATNWDFEVSSESVLPYYEVNYMRPSGTQYEADGDIITSELSYQVFFSINDDAWPEEPDNGDPE
jgi:hypothetical protein